VSYPDFFIHEGLQEGISFSDETAPAIGWYIPVPDGLKRKYPSFRPIMKRRRMEKAKSKKQK
jgi:hypothetical protein